MNTIIGKDSLIKWENNDRNGFADPEYVPFDFLFENYRNVFEKLLEWSNKKSRCFICSWNDIIDEECNEVKKKLKCFDDNATACYFVSAKFRENVGKMMAEKLLKVFRKKFKIKDYEPIEPNDNAVLAGIAHHTKDGLPIGVQVKNHEFIDDPDINGVCRDSFVKAMAMTTKFVQNDNIVPNESLEKFFSIPRQIIFSFAKVNTQDLIKEFKKSVIFIGPDKIEKLDLTPRIFESINQALNSF